MKKRSNGEGSIYKRGTRWCAQISITVDNKVKRKTVYGATQAEVKEKARMLQEAAQKGEFEDDANALLQDWIYLWLKEFKKRNLKVTTYESYLMYYRAHIKDSTIGKCKLKELTTTMLQQFYNQKAENGRVDGKGALSARTVKYLHVIINGALMQAMKNGVIDKNPNFSTELPRRKKPEVKPMTSSEIKKFLEVCRDEELYLLYLLAVHTGMRKGELLALQWDDINYEERKIYVSKTLAIVENKGIEEAEKKTALVLQEPKSLKSKRTIPLNAMLVREIKRHEERQKITKKVYEEIYCNRNLVFAMVYLIVRIKIL